MQNRGLGAWLPVRRAKAPDSIALIHRETETVSYRELADRAERVARALADRGVTRGDRVAFLGDNQPAFVEVLFGCATLGAVFVPLNTRLAPPELAHMLADSGSLLLVHDARLDDTATAAAGALPRIVVGAAGPRGYDDVLAAAMSPVEPVDVQLDEPAAILYTSGTTGRPKGAILTHGNLTWNALNVLVDVDIVSTDVALVISPLFHAASLGMGLLPIILKGATAVLEPAFDPGRTLRLIEQHRVTMLSGVPTTFQFLAEHPDWAGTDITSLRKLTCGGSPVPSRVAAAYETRGLSFSLGYGLTETSPGATYLPAALASAKAGTSGLPHFFTEVRIVDEAGEPLPPGTVGEIQVRGPNVSPGYHGDPTASAAAHTGDGWLRTGDLGRLDGDGCLVVSDRVKDMIISGGENIYPAEVEDLIMGIDAVSGAAVIGVADERWGETPWAIVTVKDGADLTTEQLIEHLSGRIAKYKIPKRVVVVPELPRTASGKVRKADLRAQAADWNQ